MTIIDQLKKGLLGKIKDSIESGATYSILMFEASRAKARPADLATALRELENEKKIHKREGRYFALGSAQEGIPKTLNDTIKRRELEALRTSEEAIHDHWDELSKESRVILLTKSLEMVRKNKALPGHVKHLLDRQGDYVRFELPQHISVLQKYIKSKMPKPTDQRLVIKNLFEKRFQGVEAVRDADIALMSYVEKNMAFLANEHTSLYTSLNSILDRKLKGFLDRNKDWYTILKPRFNELKTTGRDDEINRALDIYERAVEKASTEDLEMDCQKFEEIATSFPRRKLVSLYKDCRSELRSKRLGISKQFNEMQREHILKKAVGGLDKSTAANFKSFEHYMHSLCPGPKQRRDISIGLMKKKNAYKKAERRFSELRA